MAHRTKLIYVILITITGIRAKPTDAKMDNGTWKIDKTEDDFFYNTTDVKKDITIDINKLIDMSKCETNASFEEAPFADFKKLDSVYLNHIYSSVTTNLIEENLSIDSMELDGLDLYEVVGRECGGAKVCPNMRENWMNNKTITIGFLGAYRRSQVSILVRLYLSV